MLLRKTLMFDFDGTLVDSMVPWADGMLALLDKEGVSYPEDVIEILTPLGDRGMGIYLSSLGMKGSIDEIVTKIDAFAYELYERDILEKATVRQTLITLKQHRHRLNILSSSSHKMLDVCLKRLEMADLFDNVWSTDDYGLKKSDVEIYLRAAERLGVAPEEITHFDDNITALATAKDAGLGVIGVYDETSKAFEEQIKTVADAYIYKLEDIFSV